VAEILERSLPDGDIELGAFVIGGSGKFEYTWGRWSPDSIFEEGVLDLGSSDRVTLEGGAHHVVLNVRDRLTEAVVRLEKVVIAGTVST
jgi:hypothetical protein